MSCRCMIRPPALSVSPLADGSSWIWQHVAQPPACPSLTAIGCFTKGQTEARDQTSIIVPE